MYKILQVTIAYDVMINKKKTNSRGANNDATHSSE